jgi:hypothetical protein
LLDFTAAPRVAAGLTVASDSGGPGTWWILPPPPRPATTADGKLDLQLLRFVKDGNLTGGYLRLGLVVGVPDATVAAAAADLAAAPTDAPPALSALPLLDARADLVFFGHDPAATEAGSPLVAGHYGSTVLNATPPHRGAFATMLTPEGVRLVESGLRASQVPIAARCRFTVEGLWPSVRVTAQVDWHSAYEHFSTEFQAGALLVSQDVTHLVHRLVQDRVIQVSAVETPAPGADPAAASADVDAALAFIQTELVDRFCTTLLPLDTDPAKASLGDLPTIGAAYEVKSLAEIETAVARYDFQRSSVSRRVLTSQAALGVLAGADPGDYIVDVGPTDPFFTQFRLDCHTARPLSDSHLVEAILDVAFGTRSASLQLTASAPDAAFTCFADASADGTWTLTPRVTFASDSPVAPGTLVTLPSVRGTARDVTLDLDAALGLVHVDVTGSTDARLAATLLTVTATSGTTQLSTGSLTLQPTAPTGTVWFQGLGPGTVLTAAGQHLLVDGREVQIPPTPVDTTAFRLADPFAGTITVQIVTDAVWSELSHLDVTIQKDETSPARTFSFDAPGAVAIALDQLDPTDRSYRYRVSRVVGHVTTEDDWRVGDAPILSVGRVSASQLVVDVEPVGPELPTAGLRAVEVDLVYVDAPHQLRVEHTHVIAAKADTYEWVVPIVDPALRSYQYRVTKTLLAGGQKSTGWLDSSDPILTVALTAS